MKSNLTKEQLPSFYGGKGKMAKALGISSPTLAKYLESDKLLQYLDELHEKTGIEKSELIEIITE